VVHVQHNRKLCREYFWFLTKLPTSWKAWLFVINVRRSVFMHVGAQVLHTHLLSPEIHEHCLHAAQDAPGSWGPRFVSYKLVYFGGVALYVKECFEVTELTTGEKIRLNPYGLRSGEELTRQTSWWASIIDRWTRIKRKMRCSMSSWQKLCDRWPSSSWGTSTSLTYAGNKI